MTADSNSVYRHPSSVLTGVTGAGDRSDELTRISLKSITATKYIVQNEFLLDVFGTTSTEEGVVANSARDFVPQLKTEDLQQMLEKLQASRDEVKPYDQESDALLHDIQSLKQCISSLEREFSKEGDVASLKAENDKILKKFQNHYGIAVYEVSGDLEATEDDLNAGQRENEDEDAMDVDEDAELVDLEKPQDVSGSYYRIHKPLKFSSVNKVSVTAAEFREKLEIAKAAEEKATAAAESSEQDQPEETED